MTSGSVITETICISVPHAGQRSGSISKIRRSNRAQVALEDEALGSGSAWARAAPAVSSRSRGDGCTAEVTCEPLGAGRLILADALLAEHGKARVDPSQQGTEKPLRQPLGVVKPVQHPPAEHLLHQPRIEVRQLVKLTRRREPAIGGQHVQVRVEIGSEGAEGLDRHDQARTHVPPVEDRPEARHERVPGRQRQQPQ